MTGIRETLDRLAQRTDAPETCPGLSLRRDLRRTVAALQAVLDAADDADSAATQILPYGIPSGRVTTIEMRRRITDALVPT